MKWLVTLFMASIIGLAGTYSHVIDLQEIIVNKDQAITTLRFELKEIKDKDDAWYREQIEKWVVPYELKLPGDILLIKANPSLTQKKARG